MSESPAKIPIENGTNEAKISDVPPEMEVDSDALPSDVFEACSMVLLKIGKDYPSHRPSGLVDSQMVAQQVIDCQQTLHLAQLSSGLTETVDKLKDGFEKYTGAINSVMEHLKTVSLGARDDFDRVCEARVIQDFGLSPTKSKF